MVLLFFIVDTVASNLAAALEDVVSNVAAVWH
jgi:hypothetical protein